MYAAPSIQASNSYKPDPGQTLSGKRVYEVWKGSNRFFLGGRLIFGPDVRSLFATLFLILAPIVVFCVFVGRHLMQDFPNHTGVAIMVVAVVHTFFILVLLLLTSGRDPGIVPRNKHPPEPEEEGNSSSEWSGGQTPRLRLPRTKDVVVNGVTVKIKYCDTCMLYRPPRCSHCSICNNCVERFDHHCPWVGQCIGRRNYPYFFMFVLSTTLLCFYIFAMSALRIKKLMEGDPPHTVWKALQRSPASAFLMAYAFLATWFVGGLTMFHLYLISTNQGYTNFDWVGDLDTRRSNGGYLFTLGMTPISWLSRKQETVAASMVEAEYRALFDGTIKAIYLRSLLTALHFTCDSPSVVYCDNQSTNALVDNPIITPRMRHVGVHFYFSRE